MFVRGPLVALFFCWAAYSQAPAFEVASIKPSVRDLRGMTVSMRGGPETKDPGLFTCQNCEIAGLIGAAYGLESYRISGPDWMASERFIVTAKVPLGTTKDDFRLMQRNLLKERFHLETHWEKREMQVYELSVARNGPKIKTSVPETPDPESAPDSSRPPPRPKMTSDSEGYPVLPPGRASMMIMTGDRARWRLADESIEKFALALGYQVHGPVLDATGLKEKYDFTLSWGTRPPAANDSVSLDSSSSVPDLFTALQEQLGLKLERKKGMVDVLVIDHVEKTPTEN